MGADCAARHALRLQTASRATHVRPIHGTRLGSVPRIGGTKRQATTAITMMPMTTMSVQSKFDALGALCTSPDAIARITSPPPRNMRPLILQPVSISSSPDAINARNGSRMSWRAKVASPDCANAPPQAGRAAASHNI
ncbi:MAG: hypothetical protein H7306_07350 [Bacteriovorax sp.]|nr:hypothetical protein [Rhizobacter sp.]